MSPYPANLVELFDEAVARHGRKRLLGSKVGGHWVWLSYREMGALVRRFRSGLASLGVKRGDRVALIANNSVRWAVAAYGCYSLGAVLVPMYEEQRAQDWELIIRDSGATTLICGSSAVHHKCAKLCEKQDLRHIGLASPSRKPDSYEAILQLGDRNPIESIEPQPDDVACLIYTSGTTDDPKGVIVSHDNICSNVRSLRQVLPLCPDDTSVSFLPWAHSFGHTCELHCMISLGAAMAICPSPQELLAGLRQVQPTVLLGVPRVFHHIHQLVRQHIAKRPPLVRKLFETGLRLADRQNRGEKLGLRDRLSLEAADRLIFARVRARLGGKLKYAFCGGAELNEELARTIDNIGITIYEGYGLTEAGPVVTTNSPAARRLGSVGKPLAGVQLRIDGSTEHGEGGEIIVHGPNVTKGYYGREQDSTGVIDDSGALRTGDLGRIDEDGFLFLTGRIKEQYKLQNGKIVVPGPIEAALKLSPFISGAMVHGQGQPHNVALLVVDVDALNRFAEQEQLSFGSTAEMLSDQTILRLLMGEVRKHDPASPSYQRIHAVCLTDQVFDAENGMLTPTLKIRRRAVMKRHGDRIRQLYR